MGRGKKQQQKGGGGGDVHMQAAGGVLVLVIGMWASGLGGSRGCTDLSALNFDPSATVDSGACIGSMYDASGVFEYQTTGAAAPKQLEAIGIEFEHRPGQQMVVVTKVTPGSIAAENGVRAGDELLAVKDPSKTVLVSSRGHSGTIDAVQHVMATWPGTQLTWVLRHAAALDGIEDIDLVSIATVPFGPLMLSALAQPAVSGLLAAAASWIDTLNPC